MRHDKVVFFTQVALMTVFLAGSTLAFAQATSTAAQENKTAADQFALEEIIVTSRKLGAENLQDIPASITAFDRNTLNEMMVTNFEDFARQVPGLTFLDTSPGERRYVIRGIQSAGQQQVAVYYDEVPIPGVQSSTSDSGGQTTDLKLYDIERIEVLRGPQGTVFGANSQGGTVIYVTTQPILGKWESYVTGQISNTASANGNNWNWQAVGNIPLGDSLGIRILAYDGSDAGYINDNRCRPINPAENPQDPNTELACLDLKGMNWVDTSGLRVNGLWQPNDKVSIKGQFWWQSRDTGAGSRYHPFQAYDANPTDKVYAGHHDSVAPFTYFDEGKFVSGDYAQTPKPDDQTIYSLTGLFDLSFADMTTTLSHYKRDFNYKFDSTWIITYLLRNNINNPPCQHPEIPGADPAGCLRADLLYALTDQAQDLKQNAAEMRFNSKDSDSRWKWVVGGFWRERKSNFHSFVPVIDTNGLTYNSPNPPQQPPTSAIGSGIEGCNPCVFAREDSKDIKEWAVFGEMSFEITDTLDLNVGARYFKVDQTEVGSTLFQFAAFAPNPPDPTNLPSGATLPSTNKLSDNKTPWKIALDWQATDDLSLYALRASGYRLGGTNNRGIGAIYIPEEFESDELINYEIGAKTQFADGRFTWNTALFHMKWTNLQVAGQDLTGAFGFIGNAGSAVVDGLETAFSGAATDNLFLTAQLTYLGKKELTEDQISDDIVAPGKKGDQLPRVPKWTAGFTAQYNYQLPIDGWDGGFRVEGSYQGDSYTELNSSNPNYRYQDSYSLFNARASFHNTDMDLDIMLYITNIFNKDADIFIGAANGEPTFKVTNQPQTVGIQLTKGFGRTDDVTSSRQSAPPPPPPPPAAPPENPDLDGDGVPNGRDKCPNTRPGAVVDLDGCEVEAVISLEGVHFDFDKATLRPEAIVILNQAVGLLKTQNRVVVEIAGHTDSVGSEQYNQALSERRAIAVKDYLESQGISATRLTARGYGEAQPVASNDTEEGRAQNRRVELIVLDR